MPRRTEGCSPAAGSLWGTGIGALSVKGVACPAIDGEWKRGYEPGQPFSEAFAQSLFTA